MDLLLAVKPMAARELGKGPLENSQPPFSGKEVSGGLFLFYCCVCKCVWVSRVPVSMSVSAHTCAGAREPGAGLGVSGRRMF